MFDEKEYKEMFSHVTASGETHRIILNMAKEKKQNGIVDRIKDPVAATFSHLDFPPLTTGRSR